jgi:NADH:ubiquinone oxidoreductase subunit F (NADH-binding)
LIDPENIDHYIAQGYSGLNNALQMEPEDVSRKSRNGPARGRGGAANGTEVDLQESGMIQVLHLQRG